MELSRYYYEQLFGRHVTIPNRVDALQKLDQSPQAGGKLHTRGSLREIYSQVFEAVFWDYVGDYSVSKTAADLVPVRVNPMAVLAAQSTVSASKVKDMLELPPNVFGRLVRATHDPTQPVVLVSTPHGMVTVNGHHRMKALQLLDVRSVQVYAVPVEDQLMWAVFSLFRRYGYIDKLGKLVYIKDMDAVHTNSSILTPTLSKVNDDDTKGLFSSDCDWSI